MFQHIQEGQVIAVVPRTRRVIVQLASAQVIEARMGYHGPADAMRVSHGPLPGRGTWGIVLFPNGDNRAGVWLCAIYPSLADAFTTETDQFMDYRSHWSGAYELMDQEGRWTKSLPDGTFIQISDSTAKPTTYRHTVDQNQTQQLVEFKDSERVPNPPKPRYITISHASGTTNITDPAGNVIVTGAKGATCTLTFGGATFVVDDKGNITGTAASGAQVQLNANGGTITINKNGGIEANAAAGQNLKFSSGGMGTSYTLVRTDLLVDWLNNHIHYNGNNGGNTGTPVTPASAGAIQSNIANVSE